MPKTHGHGGKKPSPEYSSWVSMKKRCYYPKSNGFDNYGGKGIIVCERWENSFENFLADMGLKPTPKHTIDRYPDKTGNYEPGNCRWATDKEQRDNQSKRHTMIIDNNEVLISDLPRNNSLSYKTALARITRGWDGNKALQTPKKERCKRGIFGKTPLYLKNDKLYIVIYKLMIINNIPIARASSNGITKSIIIKQPTKYKCPQTILSGANHPTCKIILGTNTLTNETKIFYGLKEAAIYLNGAKSNIANVLSGFVKTYKKWSFKHI